MVKALLALAAVQQAIVPSQGDMEAYINNYINNTCQYLRYFYNETQQKYELYDKIYNFDNQTANTNFNFTLFLDYQITERITHLMTSPLGDAFTIYLAYGYNTTQTPNIMGVCTKILTLDSNENKFKTYNLETYEWETTDPTVLKEIPANKITNEIFVYNQEYAKNSEGYKTAYNNGYNIGYSTGYNTGYGQGQVATTPLNNTFDLFKTISTSLASFWNIQILPGINLGLLISIPITTGIVIWVVKALKE